MLNVDKIAGSITSKIASQKNAYVNNRVLENASKLGDSFSKSKKAEYLSKIADKASNDWLKSNKLKTFVMNNSKNILKAGAIGAAVVAVGSALGLVVKHVNDKK